MTLSLDYFNIFSSSKNFYTDLRSLINFNVSNSHVEESKGSQSDDVYAIFHTLNANNDTISAIRRVYERHVIRTKLNIQSITDDDAFNAQFEKNLRQWSKKGNCELTGRFYRGSAERFLVGETEVLSGGFILRHHFDKRFLMGYKFEIIPLSAIDRTKNNFISGLFHGIQTDKFGEIKEIHIYTNNQRTESKPIPYKELTLHVKIWLDATQYSGISPLSPMLASLDLLQEYTAEEMKGAKNRAKNNLIIKTHFYEEMKRIAQKNANGNITSQQLAEIYRKFKLDDDGDISGAKYIPSEDEVVELGKSTQSVYGALDQTTKRAMSVGAGLTPMSTFGEMPSSYNATLYFAQQEEGTFEIALEDFVEGGWREVIEVKLILGMILVDKIKVPSSYWIDPTPYREMRFMRASSAHIDPTKVQQARTDGLNNNTMNPIDLLASDGVDYEEHIAKEVKYELARKKAFEDAKLTYVQKGTVPEATKPKVTEGNPKEEEDA